MCALKRLLSSVKTASVRLTMPQVSVTTQLSVIFIELVGFWVLQRYAKIKVDTGPITLIPGRDNEDIN